MMTLLKKLTLSLLHSIRKMISVILNHTIPSPRPSFHAFDLYTEDEIRSSYNHFKQFFYDAVFLEKKLLRDYAINEALSNHKRDYYYIEFGVWTGGSLNQFANILRNITIYGFDSFEGLKENWFGTRYPKGFFSLNKQVPKLNRNCVPVPGWIQDTLPKFISDNRDLKINFVHIDIDTYATAKFILEKIKPYLIDSAIILFDELYNYPGWSVGEFKALIDVFEEEEYTYLAFASGQNAQVAIQYRMIQHGEA